MRKNIIATDDFTSPLAGEVCFQVEPERNLENRERGKRLRNKCAMTTGRHPELDSGSINVNKINQLDCFAFARNDGMFPRREREEFVNECNEFTNSGEGFVNKVTKLLGQEGTKNLCHSERSEESLYKVSGLVSKEVSKNVIATNDFTSPLAGEVCFQVEPERNLENRERGKRLRNNLVVGVKRVFEFCCRKTSRPLLTICKCAMTVAVILSEAKNLIKYNEITIHSTNTRNDRNLLLTYLPTNFLTCKRYAFTLAEVLITLGIIGVVAAITLPIISANIQKTVLNNKFKKFYSMFSQAVQLTQQNMGYPVSCWYRDSGQLCKEVCVGRNEYGTCNAWTCEDGSPLSPLQNGNYSDCPTFEQELFNKTLKTIKFCQKDALANGCLIDTYRGTDDIQKELNPDKEYDPNMIFSTSVIKNKCSVWILADQTIIIKYGQTGTSWSSLYLVDVNGHKGPNKWGYDIFTFRFVGNENSGITKFDSRYTYATEKGGTSSTKMFSSGF